VTAQQLDSLHHRGQGFDVISGAAFAPADWDLYPDGDSSDCWRGYVCHYLIEGGTLYLAELALCAPPSGLIGVDEQGEIVTVPARWPALNGVAAERVRGGVMPWRYPALHLPLGFTGTLLLGQTLRDDSLYLAGAADFPQAKDYHDVWRLQLEQGRLCGEARGGAVSR